MPQFKLIVRQVNAKPIYDNIERLKKAVRLSHPQAREMTARVARVMRDEIASKALAARAGHHTVESTFSTASDRAPDYKMLTQLVGIRKRGRQRPYAPGWREWRARVARTNLKWRGKRGAKTIAGARTVMAGALVGESLAKMTEKGTKYMRARPFWRSAMAASRYKALLLLEQGLRDLLFSQLR